MAEVRTGVEHSDTCGCGPLRTRGPLKGTRRPSMNCTVRRVVLGKGSSMGKTSIPFDANVMNKQRGTFTQEFKILERRFRELKRNCLMVVKSIVERMRCPDDRKKKESNG